MNCQATLHNLHPLHPPSVLYPHISDFFFFHSDGKVQYLHPHIYPYMLMSVLKYYYAELNVTVSYLMYPSQEIGSLKSAQLETG